MKAINLTSVVLFTALAGHATADYSHSQIEANIGAAAGRNEDFSMSNAPSLNVGAGFRWGDRHGLNQGVDVGITRFTGFELQKVVDDRIFKIKSVEDVDVTAAYVGYGVNRRSLSGWELIVGVGAFAAGVSDSHFDGGAGVRTRVGGAYNFTDSTALTFGSTAWIGNLNDEATAIVGLDVGVKVSF